MPEIRTKPSAEQMAKQTPLMQQYWDVKSAHEDKVVLFRMGDFFEMFHSDAEQAAPVLGIALTSRNKNAADQIPMCGVPHHSIANSINKLLAHGFKIAICDQVEDPKFAKGLVKRAVTRILSPGVVYDPDTLDSLKPNYIAAIDETSASFLDTTTGEAFYFLTKDHGRKLRLLASLQPVEIIAASQDKERVTESITPLFADRPLVTVHDGVSKVAGPASAQRLLSYAVHMQGERIVETLSAFEKRELLDRMDLPSTVIRHLEIFETYKGDAQGSLFHAINRCKTSAGARLLKSWLRFPLTDKEAIEKRLDQVDCWLKPTANLKDVRAALAGLGDIQRRLGKLGNPSCHPRDLVALADSLEAGLEVCRIAAHESFEKELCERARKIAREIRETLVDEPPLQTKNGGLIRSGVDGTLDELIELSTNSHALIMELEAREKELTGIASLKVRFNNVFGYYIEITNTHKDKVPTDRYDRKQTLANAERYLTKELAELETKVLTAQSKRLELELALFSRLTATCLKEARALLKLADRWSEIDVITSFAHLATEQNYSRPKLSDRTHRAISLKASRHPVIEQSLRLPFVANDIALSAGHCLLLTGPNMAGKSTLMRQVAVASLMAQTGCFIAAARGSEIPVFDRMFTRIGASDFLSEGLSTFMVEMKETAEMLDSATENSLLILDEVGRGTSTYDGMSLAQAILEHLIENKKCTTLFATHYHELTELAARYPEVMNAHMSIHEEQTSKGPEVRFLHQLVKGPANKSYGIHVGRLAGLPATITKRAASILRKLESSKTIDTQQMSLDLEARVSETGATSLESTFESPVDVELKTLDVSKLTPLEALNQIARWQQSLT